MRRRSRPVLATVDTNLFVSGLILARGHPHLLLGALRRRDFALAVSEPLIEEYRRVLRRPDLSQRYGLDEEDIADFFVLLAEAQLVRPRRRLPVQVRDTKDRMVLATALGAKAPFLVTGDQDLLVLNGHPKLLGLAIITVRDFLDILNARPR